MVRSRTPSQGGGSQGFEMERKYSVPSNPDFRDFSGTTSEDLHAWSIYRQNLNSDFTDSALGSTDKSPLPYGNFQLRDTTVQSILSHPRYGPKSALGSNMYTYLKFGLPRVFPPNHNGSNRSATPQHFVRNGAGGSNRPHTRSGMGGGKSAAGSRGPRDGSSGYDSSDNETANHYKHNRKYRSDPDFRMQNAHPSYHHHGPSGGVNPHHPQQLPLAAMQQGGLRPAPNHWNRNKSISEANLLAADYSTRGAYPPQANYHHHQSHLRDPRRNSIADFGNRPHHHDQHISNIPRSRPMSKTESHLSSAAVPRPSVIRTDYLAQEEENGTTFIYPHLQVGGIGVWPGDSRCFNTRSHLLLNDISFEIRGGEIMAIMATCEGEGTAILDLVAGHAKPAVGDLVLNGQNVTAEALKSRVAYVQSDSHLCKHMTAMQTLKYHYDLKNPTDKLGYLKIDVIDRINVLVEDLGLEQVRNTKVSSMTVSERRRLDVACHLLLDTDIVVLDQPTKGMDIFDTFFLVEYLRQWANGGTGNALGRIVILTLHPPTYEIFTMLSRILLISAGRTMFSGRRRDMLPYFSVVDYPCPSYKNPSDYYLDLVTLDDLSAEAMLESSQRIEQLAEIFRQKQEPMSDPGPPSTLPMTVKNSMFLVQAAVLFTKSMIYTQHNTVTNWISLVVVATSLSLISGAIFWDIPNTDPQLNLNDRLGYHYSVMCLMCWPLLLLLTLSETWRNRATVERDIKDGLYSRTTYIVCKSVLNLLPSLFVWLVFLVPSYSMSGLYMQSLSDYQGFYIYTGIMLLYLIAVQKFVVTVSYLLPCKDTGMVIASLILTGLFMSSGYMLSYKDIPGYVRWLDYISPSSWTSPYLVARELSPEAIASSSVGMYCRNKQVQHQDIIVQLPCPTGNGTQVLANYGYLPGPQLQFNNYGDNVPLALVVFCLISLVIGWFAFVFNNNFYCYCCDGKNRRSRRTGNGSNKP